MPAICLIVPCYNEADRLPAGSFLSWLADNPNCSLCFVNDGSTDGTAGALAQLQSKAAGRIEIVSANVNGGKAAAVRLGITHAVAMNSFDFVGYWDADLATPLRESLRLAAALERHPECDMVLASRMKRLGARIERSAARHVIGRIFATLASLLLRLPVYDSQCGAKLFRARAAAELFADAFVTRWLFDVELLARLNRIKPIEQHGSAIEVPIGEWRDVGGSKLRLSAMARVPLDLLRVRRRYR